MKRVGLFRHGLEMSLRIPTHYPNLNERFSFFLLYYCFNELGIFTLRILILDNVSKSKFGYFAGYEIIGRLESGLEIYITSYRINLEEYVNRYVEMLLCVTRSPYLERGKKNQLFLPSEHYSIELIDELCTELGVSPRTNEKELVLTGEFIDSYTIPEEWASRKTSRFFNDLLNHTSALKTKHGIFLLNPQHLEKRVPIDEFPLQVSIATGLIELVAWAQI